MTKQEQMDAALASIDASTNDIAGDLLSLKEQIQAGTVSEESLAKLDANAAALQALGNSTPGGEGEGEGEGEGGE